jgi:hypothetical protein
MNSSNENILVILKNLKTLYKCNFITYAYRYPPDKEWFIDDLIYSDEVIKTVNSSVYISFRYQIIDKYKLSQSLSNLLEEKITSDNLLCHEIDNSLIHPNFQAILILYKSNSIIDNNLLFPFAIQLLKKYINHMNDEHNDSIVRLINKLKSPINDIINTPSSDIVKKSSLSIAITINDLIDLYKLRKNKLKLINKELNFRDYLAELEDNIKFTCNKSDEIPEKILVDSKRLTQILMNLLKPTSKLFVDAQICYDIEDSDDIINYKIEFEIESCEEISDERLYVTKKIISLMNGSLTYNGKNARFTIRVFKDMTSYSKNTLKYLKGKKICIIDTNSARVSELSDALAKWNISITTNINDNYNLLIISISLLNKLIYNINTPYLLLTDKEGNSRDITPVNSPRCRIPSISKSNILHYPIDEAELLSVIMKFI